MTLCSTSTLLRVMTSIEPRSPYSSQELERLYPKGLKLQLVQILLRHGERSPVSARFRNTGLAAHWPYCSAAKRIASVAMTSEDTTQWDELKWRRRMESFGDDDGPIIASGPRGEVDGICQLGELTDKGRQTTLSLGQRLRHLYVHQLGFMPKLIGDADMIYLRSTPIPRALESVQQCFWGMYPLTARAASFPPPTIITRTPADETLFPNDSSCRRYAQLGKAFAQRAAEKWNKSPEMDYLNRKISKWMPPDSPQVAVDSHPRLSGIMDTTNSTFAHEPETRLPPEFYDQRFRSIVEKIGNEEWFAGFKESAEYRQVGIGSLVGDLVSRMVGSAEGNSNDGLLEIAGGPESPGLGRGGEQSIKFAMNGCHDTTLAAILASFGAFNDDRWPPYTSHLALELFRKDRSGNAASTASTPANQSVSSAGTTSPSFWSSIFGGAKAKVGLGPSTSPGIARRPMEELDVNERTRLDGFYVRMRYNDAPVVVPACRKPGNHLDDDESLCTLVGSNPCASIGELLIFLVQEAFKRVADKMTPKNWKVACESNLDGSAFPEQKEEAGYY